MRTIKIYGAQDHVVVIEGGIPSDSGDELNATTHPLLREHGYMGILHIFAGESPTRPLHPSHLFRHMVLRRLRAQTSINFPIGQSAVPGLRTTKLPPNRRSLRRHSTVNMPFPS